MLVTHTLVAISAMILFFKWRCYGIHNKKHLSQEDGHIKGALMRTYKRSTINRGAVIRAMEEKIYKGENSALSLQKT